MNAIEDIFENLKQLQEEFGKLTGEYNIFSNSKFYEILIANHFEHRITIGSHGPDATNLQTKVEYKHYKESSSNHTWTFNDYSDETLSALIDRTIYFVHINDVTNADPFTYIDWYYKADGNVIASYIKNKSKELKNTRKMINISSLQLESDCNIEKINVDSSSSEGEYAYFISEIHKNITKLEQLTDSSNLLTSNKFWELFLAVFLGHSINSKQGGKDGKHDAFDKTDKKYEYKISTTYSWIFEDISDNVIENMQNLDGIYLATIDKRTFERKKVYLLDTKKTLSYIKIKRNHLLAQKLREKKTVKRLNVSISKKELKEQNLIVKKIF